jgi:DNA-binding winged helix-turn-helix (wHTH) protein/tetratricopeptide (TPR) repeat protein
LFASVLGFGAKNIEQFCEERNRFRIYCHFSEIKKRKRNYSMKYNTDFIYEFGPFSLVVEERQLLVEGRQVSLTPKALDILIILVQNSGRVLEKKEIMDLIWPDTFVEEATLAQNIFTIRKALGEDIKGVRYIETIPRRGYRFIAGVKKSYREISKPDIYNGREFSSIAILPFNSLHAGNDGEYLGLGLADTLITRLSNIKQMIVRPTRAVRKYSANHVDPVAAGKDLAVDLVLTGSIQQNESRIRVTVQLVSASDSTTFWSDKFDETFEDVFAVQDSIAEQIINTLTLKLSAQEEERVRKNYTNDPEAYLNYLKGRFYWGKWTRDGFEKGIAYFDLSVQRDPNFALAHAAIAEAYNTLSFYGYINPKIAFQVGNRSALQAIQLDPMLAEAHVALAINNFAYTWDWTTAEQEFLRAIEITSGNPLIYHAYASYLIAMSRTREACDQMDIAQKLDPLSPLINASMAYPFYFSRQYDQAINELLVAVDIDVHFPLSHKILGDVYVEKGMYEEAIMEYQKTINLLGRHPSQLAYLGRAYALSGNKTEAVEIIHELEQHSNETYVSPISIAIVCMGLGQEDRALGLLEESYRERCNSLVFINVHPAFDTLRSNTRFINLIQRMGFVS